SVDAAALREHAGSVLPAHMVPSAVVMLESIPLTPAGKLDRRALPEPELGSQSTFEAAQTEYEYAVAAVFCDVLDVERVGVTDSFFDLGGNSLVATRLVARVNSALGTDLKVLDLFEASTVRSLAERAESKGASLHRRPALVPVDRPESIPLSLAQQRMWFINQFDVSSPAYNIPLTVRLTGNLDITAMSEAIGDVLSRHESLRTVFPTVGDLPNQVIAPAEDVTGSMLPLEVVDVDAGAVEALVRTSATTGFDVTSDLPFRAVLYRCGPENFVLSIVVHHIAADGASMAPLARDVMVAYSARAQGSAPVWEPLAVQYADFALWQHAVLGDENDSTSVASRQIEFWQSALADLPDVLPLPLDRPRPTRQSMRGGVTPFTIPGDVATRLSSVAAHHESTLFMVVHSALALLLARLSGTQDIAIGTPTAGRGDAALDDLVGMFVGTLVLRTQVESQSTFGELLAGTRSSDLAAFDNTDIPFERLVDVLDPVRSTDHSPLFQVLLEFQNNAAATLELPDLTVEFEEISTGTAKFDLQLRVDQEPVDESGALSASFTYATDLFDPDTIDRFVDRFLRIVDTIGTSTDIRTGDIDILSAAERELMLFEWNDTARLIEPPVHQQIPAGDIDMTLAGLFDRQVLRSPYSTALVFEDEHVTYLELDERANQLARHLISLGVAPESHVGLAIRRSIDLLVGMYAIVKAGGAYVPIDPDHPVERSSYVLSSAQPVCILTTSRDWINIPVATPVLAVDLLDVSDRDHSSVTDSDRLGTLRESNTAYVIYTSGSTGRPKGVAVTHSAIVNRLLWMQHEYRLEPADTVLQKTPATFDVSVWEFFWPLQVGAKLVVAEPEGHRDPTYLSRIIAEEHITTAHFVPSMLAVFAAGARAAECGSLRLVFCSGEALPPATAAQFAQFSLAELHNLYGPTEAAVDVSYYHVTGRDPVTIPIGAPVWNTRLYVLDASLRLAPIGAPGELYLAGVQLARGYVGRGDLTADRFVADPFGEPGERLYRTGDLVRWRADGELEYIGRTDFQVKLRGLRIELPEIEAVLLRSESVAQAIALVHKDPNTGETLVAYVVGTHGTAVDATELTAEAARRLPAYMVPSHVVVLDSLPVNASGKLDRKALPSPEFTVAASEFVGPENPVEEIVAGVFGDLLGMSQVSVTSSFFEIGGNSLIAMRLVARLNAALGTDIGIRDLFDAPTVRALSAGIELGEHDDQAAPRLVPQERPAVVPLSLAQQRMWFINQYDTASAAYNVAFAMRLSGALDVDAMHSAIGDVLTRHESLRTMFPLSDGGPVQSILDVASATPDLTPIDADGDRHVEQLIADVAGSGFDVVTGVPLRVRLIRERENEHVLVMVVHHISSDGFSSAPLARDLMVAYSARAAGHAPSQEPLPVQYADYALWQRRYLGAESDPESVMARQSAYWVDTLSGSPEVLPLPTDRPRPAVASLRGDTVPFEIDAGVHARLAAVAAEHNSSSFMIVHAALAILLARLSGTEDISVGTPISGRGDAALDELVGMFVNTLVLRTQVPGSTRFADLLSEVRSTDLAAFTHADVPFERVVDAVDPARSTAHAPLFQVMLEFQQTERPTVTLPGLSIEGIELPNDISNFDLQLTVAEEFDASGAPLGITAGFRYATELFDADTVGVFAERLVRILDTVTADPSVEVGDIDILSADEYDSLAPVRGPRSVAGVVLPELFAGAVGVAGAGGVAVVSGSRVLSYGELDA
ncbi:amino acid adenylation domain-containing protein, partial [Rhodococcus sp. MALMAid1271]|uniref:amino acid adenylation domain-containing protein n=1 Tax=Rhodococcus sp. MALMAid1271 TaxID=3411744 RepID=UPI003B9EDDB5